MKVQRMFGCLYPPERAQQLRLRFVGEYRQCPSEFDERDVEVVLKDNYWIERFIANHNGKHFLLTR